MNMQIVRYIFISLITWNYTLRLILCYNLKGIKLYWL